MWIEPEIQWSLPSLTRLLEVSATVGDEIYIDVGERAFHSLMAGDFAQPPVELCRQYGFELVVFDISVVTDPRRVPKGQAAQAASHVVCISDDASASLLTSYLKALRSLANSSGDMDGDPIVAHPELYQSHYVAATVDLSELNLSGDSDSFVTWAAPPWQFRRATSNMRLEYQVELLGQTMVTSLQEKLGKSICSTSDCTYTLIVIPIRRPPIVKPRVSQYFGDAGGLFLLLADKNRTDVERRGALFCLASALSTRAQSSVLTDSLLYADANSRLAAAAYSVGHPMKTRSGRALRALEDARGDAVDTLGREHLLISALDYVSLAFKRLEGIGHLLDVISHVMLSRKYGDSNTFLEKDSWFKTDLSYDPLNTLREMAEGLSNPAFYGKLIEVQSGVSSAIIYPWIEGLHRPSDFFYDEVLAELTSNADQHGNVDSNGCFELRLDSEFIDGSGDLAIIIENCCEKSPFIHSLLKKGVNEWLKWNLLGEDCAVGGLYFIAEYLELTGTGELRVRVREDCNNTVWFATALKLRGLRVEV